jgi:hypothetical protein
LRLPFHATLDDRSNFSIIDRPQAVNECVLALLLRQPSLVRSQSPHVFSKMAIKPSIHVRALRWDDSIGGCFVLRVRIERQRIVHGVDDQDRHRDLFQWVARVDVRVGDVHVKQCPSGAGLDRQGGFHHLSDVRLVLGRQLEPFRHPHRRSHAIVKVGRHQPKDKIGPEHHLGHRLWQQAGLYLTRQVGGKEHQRRAPVRVPQGKLERRGRARRRAQDRSLFDAQRVEQADVGVGLGDGRGVLRERGAQVPKPRGGDQQGSVPDVTAGDHQALVEPAKDAVHDEHGIAGLGGRGVGGRPKRRVFDGATARFDDPAALSPQTIPRGTDVASETCIAQHCKNDDGDNHNTRGQPANL